MLHHSSRSRVDSGCGRRGGRWMMRRRMPGTVRLAAHGAAHRRCSPLRFNAPTGGSAHRCERCEPSPPLVRAKSLRTVSLFGVCRHPRGAWELDRCPRWTSSRRPVGASRSCRARSMTASASSPMPSACSTTAALELDGRRVGRHETIGRAGVRRGSRLSPQAAAGGADQPGRDQPESSLVLVVAEAGPATGTIVALGAGRHVVGRSPSCTVSLADAALEPHHGVFEVADAGSVRFTQLTGRVAAQVDGEPVSAAVVRGGRCDGRHRMQPAAHRSVGGSGRRVPQH